MNERLEALDVLFDRVCNSDPLDDTVFVAVLSKALSLLGQSNQEVANKLKVSRPTVSRWRAGKNLPHKVMRPRVFSYLKRQIKNEVSKYGTLPPEFKVHRGNGGNTPRPTSRRAALS